jgi:hypothetical protein
MKAKKLELRETGKDKDDILIYELFNDDKKFLDKKFLFDDEVKMISSQGDLSLKDIKKIFACSFAEFPDKIRLNNFFELNEDNSLSCLSLIELSGEKCTLEYYFIVNDKDRMTSWNSINFLLILNENLVSIGFEIQEKDFISLDRDGSADMHVYVIHENLNDNIGETDKKYSEIIHQAEIKTHAQMLELAFE